MATSDSQNQSRMQDFVIPLTVTQETTISDDDLLLRKTSQRLKKYGTIDTGKVVNSVTPRYSGRVTTSRFQLKAPPPVDRPIYLKSVKDFYANLRRDWCQQILRDSNQPWLSSDDDRLYSYRGRRAALHKDIVARTMSFGVLLDRGTFVNHYQSDDEIQSIDMLMEHDRNALTVMLKFNATGTNCPFKMTLSYNDLEKIVLLDDKESALSLYFWLKCPPRLCQADTEIPDDNTIWKRRRGFPGCESEIIGNSSVLRFTFTGKEPRDSIRRALSRLRSRSHFRIYYSPVHNSPAPSSDAARANTVQFQEFETNYALECLLSRGFRVTDQVDRLFPMLTPGDVSYPESVLTKSFHQVVVDVDNNHFVDIGQAFQAALHYYNSRGSKPEEDDDHLDNYRLVRRMVVTPSRLLFLQPELMFENRILREFGEEYCIRAVFRDEDYHKLSSQVSSSEEVEQRILSTLRSGIDVGGRHYEFLACSNSQLRDHGCWLYAEDQKGNRAADVRRWMGEFSKIRCVATYIARMGQCFSMSEESVSVTLAEGKVSHIDDVMGGSDEKEEPYCFSDGIGKISRSLASQICQELEWSVIPSAFQIRYGGSKGVVAIDTSLQGEKLEIRKSMRKFETDHSKIEVMSKTSPGRLYLNRQAITLLSGMGIPDKVFLEFQHDMLNHLAKMFLSESDAVKSLYKRARIGMNFRQLMSNGIKLTTEPFFKGMLQAVYKSFLGVLKRRARIEIPEEYGRNMIGVLDETGTLEYGQVFVQYSKKLDKAQKSRKIHTGDVVVTKFPCYHPGDVRKLKAVDVPELHHMIDCVVFPGKGPRPHPNEMAGSDLDGDEYFVTWHPDLIFSRDNYAPMHFPAPKKKVLDKSVELGDMIEFIAEYIQNDRLGFMSNAHLVKADREEEGIFSPVCIELAKLLAEAVDFAKTGYCPDLSKEQRPLRYPDFMGKRDKTTYRSHRCLGKLFRQCLAVDKVTQQNLRSTDENVDVEGATVDQSLLYSQPGEVSYREYIKSARKSRERYNHQLELLMSQFGVRSEAEIMSGCISRLDKRIVERNERYDTEKVIRAKVENLRKVTQVEFYKEFENDEEGGSRDCEDDTENARMLAKASAWYYVTYSERNPKLLSFPWVVASLLGKIKSHSVNLAPQPTNDPIIDKINDQLKASLANAANETMVDYLNHQNDVNASSTTIKEYLVAYPCLLPVVDMALKWANTRDVTHSGVHDKQKRTLSRNTLVQILLDFALEKEYIDRVTGSGGNTVDRHWKRIMSQITWGTANGLPSGLKLKKESPGHLLISFFEYCSRLQFDETLLSTSKNINISRTAIVQVTDDQMYRLGETALGAYHQLAQTGDVNNLIKGWVLKYEEEWSHELSPQSWILLSGNIDENERQFEQSSGAASVTIRPLNGRGPKRGQITAYGTIKALDFITERIYGLEQEFGNMRYGNVRRRGLPRDFFTAKYYYQYNPYKYVPTNTFETSFTRTLNQLQIAMSIDDFDVDYDFMIPW